MSTSYIPTRDSLLAPWALNFATVLAANPQNYGLTAGDAAAVTAAQAAFQNAYNIATTAATKTSVTVATKDTLRNKMVIVIRDYANIIQANIGVSQANKTALGLPIHKTTRSPVPVPTSAPTIAIVNQTPGQAKVTYHDPNQGQKIKAKPPGVKFVEYAWSPSATVISNPDTLAFKALVTKTPFNLNIAGAAAGQTVYIAARFVNTRGELGPWSTIASFIAA